MSVFSGVHSVLLSRLGVEEEVALTLLFLEKFLKNPDFSQILRLIHKSSHIPQVIFKLLLLGNISVSRFVILALEGQGCHFLSPSGSPGAKPTDF